MKCPSCNNETFIDHVTKVGETTTYTYVCVNPKCPEYKKAFTLTGGETKTQIKSE